MEYTITFTYLLNPQIGAPDPTAAKEIQQVMASALKGYVPKGAPSVDAAVCLPLMYEEIHNSGRYSDFMQVINRFIFVLRSLLNFSFFLRCTPGPCFCSRGTSFAVLVS